MARVKRGDLLAPRATGSAAGHPRRRPHSETLSTFPIHSSGFAARFTDLMGEPAMTYVTAWRMALAARLVREEHLALSRVANRIGYQSEAAFNRAFRRAHGVMPGAYARQGAATWDVDDLSVP